MSETAVDPAGNGYQGVWRVPDEETVDLYPGLVVHDGRVTGSITVGASRLPLWAFAGWDWADVLSCWDYIEELGWTDECHTEFLHNLLEMRGEFGRLLLVLADVERDGRAREDEALEGHGDIVLVTPGDPNAVQLPPPWWEHAPSRQRVSDQLRRCLAALGELDATAERD